MRKIVKKMVTCVMAGAMVFGAAVAGQPAAHAQAKTKSYFTLFQYENKSQNCIYSADAGQEVLNKKGKKKYTFTLKRNKCAGEPYYTMYQSNSGVKKAKTGTLSDTTVLGISIDGLPDEHKVKDIKVSNVVVKCDGKKVKINQKKVVTYASQGEGSAYYNVAILGSVDGSKKAKAASAKALKWKNKISVSFQITIKK